MAGGNYCRRNDAAVTPRISSSMKWCQWDESAVGQTRCRHAHQQIASDTKIKRSASSWSPRLPRRGRIRVRKSRGSVRPHSQQLPFCPLSFPPLLPSRPTHGFCRFSFPGFFPSVRLLSLQESYAGLCHAYLSYFSELVSDPIPLTFILGTDTHSCRFPGQIFEGSQLQNSELLIPATSLQGRRRRHIFIFQRRVR